MLDLDDAYQGALDEAISGWERMLPAMESEIRASLEARYYEESGIEPGFDQGGAAIFVDTVMPPRTSASERFETLVDGVDADDEAGE